MCWPRDSGVRNLSLDKIYMTTAIMAMQATPMALMMIPSSTMPLYLSALWIRTLTSNLHNTRQTVGTTRIFWRFNDIDSKAINRPSIKKTMEEIVPILTKRQKIHVQLEHKTKTKDSTRKTCYNDNEHTCSVHTQDGSAVLGVMGFRESGLYFALRSNYSS